MTNEQRNALMDLLSELEGKLYHKPSTLVMGTSDANYTAAVSALEDLLGL